MSYIRKVLRDQKTGRMLGSHWTPCGFGRMQKGSNHVLHVVTPTASIKGRFTATSKRSKQATGNYGINKTADLMLSSSY